MNTLYALALAALIVAPGATQAASHAPKPCTPGTDAVSVKRFEVCQLRALVKAQRDADTLAKLDAQATALRAKLEAKQ